MYTLTAGYRFYPMPDGSWHYLTPQESAVRIGAPTADLIEIDRLVRGERDALSSGAEQLALALKERGVLSPRTRSEDDISGTEVPPHSIRSILVDGVGPVADQCIALSTAMFDGVRLIRVGGESPPSEEQIRAADVLVSCADTPPHTAWNQIDQWCREHKTAWHRVFLDIDRVAIGPFFTGGEGSSYTDTCARRLAASAVADDLEALWNHQIRYAPGILALAAPAAAVVAALVCTDIDALLRGTTPPHLIHQTRMDHTTLALSRHPVLPLPRHLESTKYEHP